MDTLLWLLEHTKVFAQVFVDDLALIIIGKFADTVWFLEYNFVDIL